jgi:methylenetetrahydrofolate dehydrogenase (NADP+)/methenyltetrahydrofolate cyclohydrolase
MLCSANTIAFTKLSAILANYLCFCNTVAVTIEHMKMLNGRELADYVMERQAHDVRALRQAHGIAPKLAIIRTNPDPVVDSYMRIKQSYGNDILIDVDVHTIDQKDAIETIKTLNNDPKVHGIIVQIPLPDVSQTNEVLNTVVATKDVDGLAEDSTFDPPTPLAISWLLAGYNIELYGKHIVIVGHGRLVGKPLAKMWQNSELDVVVVDKQSNDLAEQIRSAEILITATGVPSLIAADMINPNAVIVDAGVATDSNGLVGDVASDVRLLPNIAITPEKGGVGPLTVTALFENVITAARRSITQE